MANVISTSNLHMKYEVLAHLLISYNILNKYDLFVAIISV